MDKKLQAEIWEVQIILYWILSVLLFSAGHSILGWIAFAYGLFCLPSTVRLLM